MLLLLSHVALANDTFPGLSNPSVVPSDDTVQLELSGGGGFYTGIFVDGTAVGGMFAGSVRLSDRTRVGVYGTLGRQVHCWTGLFGAGECHEGNPVDGVVTASHAFVASPTFRLGGFVAVGTYAQAGLSVWVSSRSGRVAFDASYGPGLETEPLLGFLGPKFEFDGVTVSPDLGVTFGLDRKAVHHLRLGMTSLVPTLTYRLNPGPVGLEASIGSVGVVNFARLGVTGRF